ncbi:MAG: hypothetical protein EP299_01750 [Acidobacteria bacterium]|nr:MAG: hypothetical protein EP299_01750 [Acidobacteriota bacterium]
MTDSNLEDYINIPKPFDGSKDELVRNLATHDWYRGEGGYRCDRCECRYGGGVSKWPCGSDPRELVPRGSLEAEMAYRSTVVAAGLTDALDRIVKEEANGEQSMDEGDAAGTAG